MAATLDILGLVAHGRGDYILAEARLSQSLNSWRQLNQPTELARALTNQAVTLQTQSKFEAALAHYQEAAAVLEPTASNLEKASVQNSLGTLHFTLGHLAEAEAAFRRANSSALQQSANPHLQAQVGQNLGNVLLEQGQLEGAEAYLSEAIVLWRQTEDEVMLATTLGNLAETWLKQGQPQAAVPLYDEAIALLARYPHDAWAVQLLGEFRAQRQALSAP
jgi:tetratricopeptide (TPR) repeat protein